MSLPSRFAAGLPTVAPEVLDRMVSDRGAECPYCGFPSGLKSPVCDVCRDLAARAVEGPPGTGKSAAAHVVAEELGCTAMSKHTIAGNKLNVELAETVFGSMTRFVPMDGARFHVVIIEEFERCVSPEVRAYLKTALDTGVEPPDGLPPRCIVIATSNDVAKIEPALLERFRVLNFSAGPCCLATRGPSPGSW